MVGKMLYQFFKFRGYPYGTHVSEENGTGVVAQATIIKQKKKRKGGENLLPENIANLSR